MKRAIPVALAVLIMAIMVSPASAQDPNFTNFETPQTKSIDTVTLTNGTTSISVILVCNTPDNSVEIYDAAAPHRFIQRVPVGLGPGTVKYLPAQKAFYVCNFDGDSVSKVRLDLMTGPMGLTVFGALEKTVYVGDQPADISFDPTGVTAIVTLSGRSSVSILDAATLNLTTFDSILSGFDATLNIPLAVKAPRRIEWLPDNRIFVANFMGDTVDPASTLPSQYDMDLWFLDPANPNPIGEVQNLGSTNHSFTITSGGVMVMAGTLALNHSAVGEPAVAALPFGFVESRIWVIDLPVGGQPIVRAELPSGVIPLPPVAASSHNLNLDYGPLSPTPVSPADALSQPTDVEVIEDGSGGIDTIVVTAYHSDKIVLMQPASVAGGYLERQVNLPVLTPGAGYSTSGPRSVTFNRATGLLYVSCRLDNSVRVIDPSSGTVTASFQLRNDPTPNVIREGRVFLYNATQTSGNGFVSCASCHIDAGTDKLPWDLGEAVAGPAFPTGLIGVNFDPTVFPNNEFPSQKGPLITQTLQGLVNYHVNTPGQYLFTNAPYHWRGDRPTFNAFNPAFVGLLGRPNQLTTGEMQQYTEFINTVRHPGNPEQALDRRVPGTLDPVNPDDWQLATGPKLGLQIYHNANTDVIGSCAGCHALPEGSDNTVTEAFTVAQTITGGPAQFQPFETAQLRNLVPREMWLHRLPGIQGPLTGLANTGTFHDGSFVAGSINLFNQNFFSMTMPGNTSAEQQTNLEAVTAFVRQFDWGTSSIVGIPFTIDETTINTGTGSLGSNQVAFDVLRDSVEEANSGGMAIVRQGQVYRGFWYDTTVGGWREEGTANVITEFALASLAIGGNNEVILQATPLGSDRRMANMTGVATQLSGAAPANILPEPMAPMTYYTDIPLFQQFLQVNQGAVPPVVLANPLTSVWALRTFQISVLGNFGVNALSHTPPRRFRVVGDNIRPGAKLLIGIPNSTPGAFPVDVLQLDIFPTNRFNASNQRIWESEEELDPMLTYLMLNGGPYAPSTVAVAQRTTTTPALQPLVWNSFGWAVLNEDGTLNSTINFAPITVQDVR